MSCLYDYKETVTGMRGEMEILLRSVESLLDKVCDLESALEDSMRENAQMKVKVETIDQLRDAARDYYDTTREPNADKYVVRTVSHMLERALEAAHA